MLNVRYGSGCSRIVTACAARPSLCKSRQANRARHSSGVIRVPSAAFARMRSMVVMGASGWANPARKGGGWRGLAAGPTALAGGVRPKLLRKLSIPLHPFEFLRPELEPQDVAQVPSAEAGV